MKVSVPGFLVWLILVALVTLVAIPLFVFSVKSIVSCQREMEVEISLLHEKMYSLKESSAKTNFTILHCVKEVVEKKNGEEKVCFRFREILPFAKPHEECLKNVRLDVSCLKNGGLTPGKYEVEIKRLGEKRILLNFTKRWER